MSGLSFPQRCVAQRIGPHRLFLPFSSRVSSPQGQTDRKYPFLYFQLPDYESRLGLSEKFMARATPCICQVRSPELALCNLLIFACLVMQAARTRGTSARLQAGDEVRVLDLLFGLMLPSGNDAARALAEHVGSRLLRSGVSPEPRKSPNKRFSRRGGGCQATSKARSAVQVFVDRMNRTASLAGCTETVFTNPHGMDSKPAHRHHSSASDVTRMVRFARRFALFRQLVRTTKYSCTVRRSASTQPFSSPSRRPARMAAGGGGGGGGKSDGNEDVKESPALLLPSLGKERSWSNTHKLLGIHAGVDGVKTGITPAAGPCLCTSFARGDRRIIVVVLHCSTKEKRYEDSMRLAQWGWRRLGVANSIPRLPPTAEAEASSKCVVPEWKPVPAADGTYAVDDTANAARFPSSAPPLRPIPPTSSSASPPPSASGSRRRPTKPRVKSDRKRVSPSKKRRVRPRRLSFNDAKVGL